MSETDTCREWLSPYCRGSGIDIGAGGSPITPWAICIDRAEGDERRSHAGNHPTHLAGDAADLRWFKDESLDFAFSSHCLEDAEDTKGWLKEWLRVLRRGGHLVLFLPDQATYEAHCKTYGAEPNQAHKHKDFSLHYVKMCLATLGVGEDQIVETCQPFPGNPYSFGLVIRKR